MSRTKKIIVSIIIMLLAILGFSNTSHGYFVGQKLSVSYWNYASSSNIFCVEHKQALRGTMTYRIISQVNIEGNTSIDYTGHSITHSDNAKLAAILTYSGSKGTVSNAIWNFMYTWMSHVGQYHAGLYNGFASDKTGVANSLDTSSTNYANSIKDMKITDNTNKNNIKVTAYERNGKQYMRVGPFNWKFSGTLTGVNVYDQNGQAVNNVLYSSFNGTKENWFEVGSIKSGSDFYVSVPLEAGVTKITKITGTSKVDVKGVKIWFLEANTGYYQNLIIREPRGTSQNIDASFEYNISILGNLKVIKVNKDNEEIKLQGVGFYIQNKNTGKYVKQEGEKISYVDTKEQATEFITDNNGEIEIKNLIVGTYVAYETKNPNYGYEIITEGQEKTITVDKTAELKRPNKQVYVKLSGYVWVDKQDGKTWVRNDLMKDNYHPEISDYVDGNDMLLDGITVRLKDKTTGETVKEMVTADGGAYLFTDVLIEKLGDYYIEFEYDGLTYTNVVPHLENEEHGSKSAEGEKAREEFNNNFSTVEGRTENTGFTRDANGNEKYSLSYNIDNVAHTSTLINNGQYIIMANTEEADYSIKGHFTYGQEEIKYINLGLYEREQPDMALVKDLESVRLDINGYSHVYQYAQRNVNAGEYESGFNVGVKFGNEYGKLAYSRAVYKADYEYINENNKDKELKVYVTYKISMKNQSTTLTTKINSIADYYDSNYKIVSAGTKIDEKADTNGDISYTESEYNTEYRKAVLDTNMEIEHQNIGTVYVQFELNREAVLKILNDQENLENVAEINSYSIFKDGKVYAGIDVDSNPASATPGDISTYQDDTDTSPNLKLEVADAREMTGKVFLDSTSGELMTGQIRQGSGVYEDGEIGIRDVAITLTENTGSGKIYTATTDENGDFYISGFIPGDYTLTYTWGDETYTVQHYKGTIYNEPSRAEDPKWYKQTDPRYSDAMDNYQTRQEIDNEMKYVENSTQTTMNKMESTTPTMEVGVEYETTYTASTGDRYTYQIKNIDFGIVERARQDIELTKRVKAMKVTLANGQVIVDFSIDEDGKLTGERNHITYMEPSNSTTPKNGLVKLELDNELIQGATVEVTYEIKVTNISELDYLSENFYKYGIIEGDVVKIEPTGIIDYLDRDWAFDTSKQTTWEEKTVDEIKDIVADDVYNSANIKDRIILYTESLKGQKLEPTESRTLELETSKVLANNDEIELDNEVEVAKVTKDGGADLISIPGNYVPGTYETDTEHDNDMAETVIVTPSTGDDQNISIPIIIGITALVVLGVGVFFIKKKTLK